MNALPTVTAASAPATARATVQLSRRPRFASGRAGPESALTVTEKCGSDARCPGSPEGPVRGGGPNAPDVLADWAAPAVAGHEGSTPGWDSRVGSVSYT
ncbi:hypothetical protein, partial [Streptomyces sp. I8-5]|uniref:hypothetical protein n=1 Tax=Streptomyces sp. I8-5 TaxID=3104277 RepID=UPI003864BB2D